MAENPVKRELVEGFYAAYAGRDAARFAEFLDDNVEWTVSGPVDLLPFCGTHNGKAAVLEVFERRMPEIFSAFRLERDSMLFDGNRVATLNRWTARRTDDGWVVSYRLAHFMRFRNDKLAANVPLIDSYDAAEQVLGHSLADHSVEPAHGENLVRV